MFTSVAPIWVYIFEVVYGINEPTFLGKCVLSVGFSMISGQMEIGNHGKT